MTSEALGLGAWVTVIVDGKDIVLPDGVDLSARDIMSAARTVIDVDAYELHRKRNNYHPHCPEPGCQNRWVLEPWETGRVTDMMLFVTVKRVGPVD